MFEKAPAGVKSYVSFDIKPLSERMFSNMTPFTFRSKLTLCHILCQVCSSIRPEELMSGTLLLGSV